MLAGCLEFPDEFAQRYIREGYWRGETLGSLLARRAKEERERIAIVDERRRLSYAELDDRSARLAAGMVNLGIRQQDRVVVQLPNVIDLPVVILALLRLGALPVFALPNHRRAEITYLCDYSQAVAYVTADTYRRFDYRLLAQQVRNEVPSLEHVLISTDPQRAGEENLVGSVSLADLEAEPQELPPVRSRDVAFFLLSGGTTGMPKLIPRTHDDYAYQLRATAEAVRAGRHTVYLAAQSAAHNAALGSPGMLGTLLVGGRVVLAGSPSPDEAFPLIQREGVTLTTLMPPVVQAWLEAADLYHVDMSGVLIQVGSARFAPELASRVFSELGCSLSHWFGMAEGIITYTRLDDPQDIIASTQGRPLCAADEIRVVDADDHDVAPGEVGELLARGPYTLRGYYRAQEHNAKSFTDDGFLRTGDLVRITAAGNMVVEGRIKDVIVRGGEKISAGEIEDHLLCHSQIREAAVVAMPDEIMGEKSCAFVVPRGYPLRLADLATFLRDRGLANYKIPDRLELVESLPRTSAGKINKAKLREEIAARMS
jgi:2,3-dihydroxybenzoate-AMP ligase